MIDPFHPSPLIKYLDVSNQATVTASIIWLLIFQTSTSILSVKLRVDISKKGTFWFSFISSLKTLLFYYANKNNIVVYENRLLTC